MYSELGEKVKLLRKRRCLNKDDLALILNLSRSQISNLENRKIASYGGQVASNTRKDIESRLGESIVTKDNKLNYEYVDETKKLSTK